MADPGLSGGVFAKGLNQVERKISQVGISVSSKVSHLFSMESMNCVTSACLRLAMRRVGKELEDGEINNPLDRQFRTCMRKELERGRTQRNREAENGRGPETAP